MDILTIEELETFLESPAMDIPDEVGKSHRKEEKGNYFAVVLYPDEDERHSKFLRYVTSRPQYDYVYIKHLAESADKKDHIHCLIKTLDRMAVGAFVHFFSGWINYAECIHSPKAYIMYLLHDTPEAIEQGKRPYSVNDLVGSTRLYKHLIQNSHFVQLAQIMKYHPFHGSLLDTYQNLPDDLKKELGDFMWSYYHIVSSEIKSENENVSVYYNSNLKG